MHIILNHDFIDMVEDSEILENVIPTFNISAIKSSLKYHPDIQIHPIDNNNLVCAPECYDYYRNCLPTTINIIKGSANIGDTYPSDCAYNVTRVGNFVICNTKIIDRTILNIYKDMGFTFIHTNQGYSKCNIAIIDEETILTEDEGIHNTIIVNQIPIKTYLMQKGEIFLNGFDYGFIGGACGLIENRLLWYGNPQNLSYYKQIKEITEERQILNISLSNQPLGDFGGIICLP